MNNDIIIAVGSNLGDRLSNILTAFNYLKKYNIYIKKVSPIYETPAAMLIENSINEWNIPFLNCVIDVDTNLEPIKLLDTLKIIEKDMGRDFSNRWSPRVIDLDIIFYKNVVLNTDRLKIPHPLYKERNFVLDPLSFIKFDYVKNLNFYNNNNHQPLLMAILNITPDSFSDGGVNNNFETFKNNFDNIVKNNIGIIDIGAESTRPTATKISHEEEIERLKPVFEYTKNFKFNAIKPLLSIDTYHYETAQEAIKNNFDIVNDINGLEDPEMLELAKSYKNKYFVFMHNKDIKNVSFKNTISEIEKWLESRLNTFSKNNIDFNNLIFDIGIGFGKSASQSLQILQNISNFHKYGIKLLVGHSRKSFMNIFTKKEFKDRDIETIAIGLGLTKNVDILRVHNVLAFKEALIAKMHLNNQFF